MSGSEAPDWRGLFLASLPRGQITEKYLSKDGQQLEVFLNGKNGKEYRINAEIDPRAGFVCLVQSDRWDIYCVGNKIMVFNGYQIRRELRQRGYRFEYAGRKWVRNIHGDLKEVINEIVEIMKLKGVM